MNSRSVDRLFEFRFVVCLRTCCLLSVQRVTLRRLGFPSADSARLLAISRLWASVDAFPAVDETAIEWDGLTI